MSHSYFHTVSVKKKDFPYFVHCILHALWINTFWKGQAYRLLVLGDWSFHTLKSFHTFIVEFLTKKNAFISAFSHQLYICNGWIFHVQISAASYKQEQSVFNKICLAQIFIQDYRILYSRLSCTLWCTTFLLELFLNMNM